jgi:hypothetical protein
MMWSIVVKFRGGAYLRIQFFRFLTLLLSHYLEEFMHDSF